MDIKDCIIYEKTIPAHPAVYDDFPENLLPELAEYLKSHGIGKLYCHQTEMFEKVTSGKNAVITTPTASGKTLSFLLPVLQDILKNPLTRAIFIYPTKALAADQYRAIAPYLNILERTVVWRACMMGIRRWRSVQESGRVPISY